MGESRRIHSARAGIVRASLHDDDRPDDIRMHVVQDVEPTLEHIAQERELVQPHALNKKLASLPEVIAVDLFNRGILFDEDRMKVWLNSSEATPWRVWNGLV